MSIITKTITFSFIASAAAKEFEVVSDKNRLVCETKLFLLIDGGQQYCYSRQNCINFGGVPEFDGAINVCTVNHTCPQDQFIFATPTGRECVDRKECQRRDFVIEGDWCNPPSCGSDKFLCVGQSCPTQCLDIDTCNKYNRIVDWETRTCEIPSVRQKESSFYEIIASSCSKFSLDSHFECLVTGFLPCRQVHFQGTNLGMPRYRRM